MKQLNECIKYVRAINNINERISEIEGRATSPKGQKITGMPKGGTMGNQTESYMIKLEALESRRKKLETSRLKTWNEVLSVFSEHSVKKEYIELMWYRFYHGYQWKTCEKIMIKNHKDQNWNINKCFRIYRKILNKCNNS